MADNHIIYTIGHSNHKLEYFIDILVKNKIEVIVDVRSTPYSKINPQFNRESLTKSLDKSGIKYLYLGKELGGRPKNDSDYVDGVADYNLMTAHKEFQDGIYQLIKMRMEINFAIMCSEKDPLNCHRMLLIGRELTKQGIPVVHILEDGSQEDNSKTEERLIEITGIKTDLFDNQIEDKQILDKAYKKRSFQVSYRKK